MEPGQVRVCMPMLGLANEDHNAVDELVSGIEVTNIRRIVPGVVHLMKSLQIHTVITEDHTFIVVA